jgi:hypothetical protein
MTYAERIAEIDKLKFEVDFHKERLDNRLLVLDVLRQIEVQKQHCLSSLVLFAGKKGAIEIPSKAALAALGSKLRELGFTVSAGVDPAGYHYRWVRW